MSVALSISGLKKTYPSGFTALKGIDLIVKEGDFFALLGPNGAGKSTTIGIVCSLINKTEGKVHIFDTDIDTDFAKAKQYLGIVPQEFNFNHFDKVGSILITQAGYYGIPAPLAKQRAEKYMRQLGLWDKRDAVSRTLSGGMKRRLMIARALVHEPKLLILDEPTAGVDIELRRSMWEFLRRINEEGTTIILTTHYLEEAESLCRKIAIIDEGKIVIDTNMKTLLKQLNKETFILDLVESVPADFALENFPVKVLDENQLEIILLKGQSINTIFAALDQHNISVSSMRNKSNRLEELFVDLLNTPNEGAVL